MNRTRALVWLSALSLLGCAPEKPSPEEVAFARDEQVLSTVFKHFLEDGEEHFLAGDEPILYLHKRNPEKLGILHQTDLDLHDRKLREELIQKLILRNGGPGFDSTVFSFEGYTFDSRVKVVDIEMMLSSGRIPDFPNDSAFEKSKGYFHCFAPANSADGTTAHLPAKELLKPNKV